MGKITLRSFDNDMGIDLRLGDCLKKIKDIPDKSIDACITDPPYGLVSIVKRFGKEGSAPAKFGTDGAFSRASKGFMGKEWDGSGIENNVEMWKECLRVLKPGGHLLSFGGTRTYHRMAVAIEDAGFEIRDMIEWLYGSGFPKSLNIGKAVARLQGEDIPKTKGFNVAGQGIGLNPNKELRSDHPNYVKPTYDNEWEGWGTALKPAHEPICMARKPLSEKTVAENVLKYGTGGINIDESRVEIDKNDPMLRLNSENHKSMGQTFGSGEKLTEDLYKKDMGLHDSKGRFPANLIHDNSEEVRECFPDTKPTKPHGGDGGKLDTQEMGWGFKRMPCDLSDNGGNASRYFKSIIYTAKASKSERNRGCEGLEEKEHQKYGTIRTNRGNGYDESSKLRNNHPTVKPIALMEYLIKMITPKGGVVLDPFMGSGSTGIAAKKNKFGFIGIEIDEKYFNIAKKRIDNTQGSLF